MRWGTKEFYRTEVVLNKWSRKHRSFDSSLAYKQNDSKLVIKTCKEHPPSLYWFKRRPLWRIFLNYLTWVLPLRDMTPMKRKTPYRTGMGRRARMGVMNTDNPVRIAISRLVTLCSRIPRNLGFSPGIFVSLS